MRKTVLGTLILLVLASGLSARQGTSVGIILGVPTGMNFKSWLSETSALNVNFGVNPLDKRYFMNFDILPHWEVLYNAPFYLGGGLRLEIDSDNTSVNNFRLGLRGIAGIEKFFGESPFAVFLEIGGAIDLLRNSGFFFDADPNGAIGLRFYISK